MKMKKFLAILTAGAMTFGLAACGNDSGDSAGNSAGGAAGSGEGSGEVTNVVVAIPTLFDINDAQVVEDAINAIAAEKHAINKLVGKYPNISGSDIANAVWMAALDSAERCEELVGEVRFVSALEKIAKAKIDNRNPNIANNDARVVSVREVDEEYALEQIKKGKNTI